MVVGHVAHWGPPFETRECTVLSGRWGLLQLIGESRAGFLREVALDIASRMDGWLFSIHAVAQRFANVEKQEEENAHLILIGQKDDAG